MSRIRRPPGLSSLQGEGKGMTLCLEEFFCGSFYMLLRMNFLYIKINFLRFLSKFFGMLVEEFVLTIASFLQKENLLFVKLWV